MELIDLFNLFAVLVFVSVLARLGIYLESINPGKKVYGWIKEKRR